jgi:hypothetical protein
MTAIAHESRSRVRSRKHSAVAMVCAIALGLGTATTPKPAKADPVVAIEALVLMYEVFSIGAEIFGGDEEEKYGPRILASIAATQAALSEWMRISRNLEMVSQVGAAAEILQQIRAHDLDNEEERRDARVLLLEAVSDLTTLKIKMEGFINSSDIESAYELAAAYNVLVALGATFLHAKREVTAPAHWEMFDTWFRSAVQTNYKLIAARRHECWDESNPGHFMDSADRTIQYLFTTAREGHWKSSRLYKKIANRNFRTYKKEGFARPLFGPIPQPGQDPDTFCEYVAYHHKCNPETSVCTFEPFWCSTWRFPPPRVTLSVCGSHVPDMSCAKIQAEEAFRSDPVVRVVGAGQDQIMRRSGGNWGADAALNDLFLFHGRVVDPWVDEPSCPSGYAYPQEPL